MFRKSCLIVLLSSLTLAMLPSAAKSFEDAEGMRIGGSPSAPIRFEVYSDFACPGCRRFYRDIIRPLLRDYAANDKVCIVYQEFPLEQKHIYSRNAARYCEAAFKLGREQALRVMDVLFEEQGQWSLDGNIEKAIAKALPAAELVKLKMILKDPSIDRSIDRGMKQGLLKGIRGTPTLFIYHSGKQQKIDNPQQLAYVTVEQFINGIVK